jgi:dTDP-4-dehydrorhamnose reductase
MTIMVLGADGQVGYELHRAFAPLGSIAAYTRGGSLPGGAHCGRVDFAEAGSIAKLIADKRPKLVLNAVAHTQVDRAEDEPALAQRINVDAVAELAQACAMHDVKLVHYSTDYVFGGEGRRPWKEDDATAPLGVYGRTKLAGEEAIRASGCRHMILRTAWVYAARGQNFLRTALRLAGEREELRIVSDQVGSPTPARWLAVATALAHARNADAIGTWHVVADGECSWYQFAAAIYSEALATKVVERAPRLVGIPSSEYPTKAKRPAYSRLDTTRFASDFGLQLPDWRDGLRQVVGELAEQMPG